MDSSSRQHSQNAVKRMGTRKHPLHFGKVNTIVNQSEIDPSSQSTLGYNF